MKISIWLFDDAPQKYQDMSRHGSDEDWVVVFHDLDASAWDLVVSPLYELLPEWSYWDTAEQQQVRDYVKSWGFVWHFRDGNDLVAITAHA